MSEYPGPPPAVPERRGTPGWVWALASCGGCGVVVLIAAVALFFYVGNTVRQAFDVGPLDSASVQKALGTDVPLYPGSTVDEEETRVILGITRAVGTFSEAPMQAVSLNASDSPEKVFAFYDQRLPKLGWKRLEQASAADANTHVFEKGAEQVHVTATLDEDDPSVTTLILMRGSTKLLKDIRSAGNSPSEGEPAAGNTPGR